MKNALILFVTCLSFCLKGKAQSSPSLQITGRIIDSVANKPIGFATVLLNNDKKIQLKSAISAKDGSFALTGLSTGNYSLHLVYVGYRTKILQLTLTTTSKALGNIALLTSSTQLKGVEVTADRPLVKQEIDRISYDVKADPESKVNSVLEMMRKVPLLSVDGEDNIQLQGNSNYKILINGRPSGMMERNPKDILRSMPASNIEKIEVITTPPAKYDGEGLAGIINIITFKKQDNGTKGTINVSERFPVGGPGIGGTFTAKVGKFGIATNAGGNLNNSPLLNNSNNRLTQGGNATNLLQTGSRDLSGKTGYAGAEISYDIDSLNLISGQFSYNANRNENFNARYSTLNNLSTTLQSYELRDNVENSGDGIDLSLNYQLGFKKDKNRLLTFSYRYYTYSNNQFNNVDIFNPVAYNLPDYEQNNTGGSDESTVQLDYVYPLKKVTIEAGIKAIFRNNKSNFEYLSANPSGILVVDPLKTNGFDNRQDVYGIYNTYQFNIKKWGVKAGIRAEQTEIDADFSGTTANLNTSALNLIPSVSINRKFKNMSSINFGYASRIQRPGITQLNPFVDRSNPNFELSGNPDLKPVRAHAISVGYSKFKKASWNLGFRALLFDDLIMSSIVTDPTTQITRRSFANTGDAALIGVALDVNYPFTSKLKGSLSTTANYGMIKGVIGGTLLEKKGLLTRGFTQLSYRPNKTWQTSASMNYNGRSFTLQGSTNPFIGTSFSVSKSLFSDKLTLSFAANNVFNKYRNVINTITGPNFIQESYDQNYQRNFTTSLNYSFGRLKESIKKNKKGINNNDVSEGSSL